MVDESTRKYREELQGHLTELLETVNRIRAAIYQGGDADASEVQAVVQVLTEGVYRTNAMSGDVVSLPARLNLSCVAEQSGSKCAEILYFRQPACINISPN